MKKLLLATTALTLSAGVAAADVALSGDGRMGLVYDGSDVTFTSRARVTFTLSGETDTGLAFGGSFRADQASTGANNGTLGNVFISGDFGRLAMGDVAGAARAAVGDLHGVGLTGLGDRNEMAYIGRLIDDEFEAVGVGAGLTGADIPNNRPRALYTYSIDGLSVYVSVDNPVTARNASGDKVASLRNVAIGASYSFDGFTVAAGYEDARIKDHVNDDTETAKHLIASAMYDFDGISVKGIAGRVSGDLGAELAADPDFRRTQYGLSVSGTFDATTVTAFANRNFATTDYGLGASYDLGGGAAITGGIVRTGSNSGASIERNTTADFGLAFSF